MAGPDADAAGGGVRRPGEAVHLAEVPFDDPAATALRLAQEAEMRVRYDSDEPEPGDLPSADDVAAFLLAREGGPEGAPVGCVALRLLHDHAESTAEIKRMYVVPERRRTGLGAVLLDAVEARARGVGVRRLRLECGDRQPDALALYRGRGYGDIPAYGHYAEDPRSVCLERLLG